MHASILIPNSSRHTTPLGVGLATLMREPSASRQQRLLHAAHEAGFRHFDVAPSYGFGAAERVLGRFLRTRPEGVTIGTKVGIVARGNAGLIRLVERPARAVMRRFPGLRGRAATQAVGGAIHTAPNFSFATRTRSLEGSLRALGVETIDLYLLHEARPSDVVPEVVEWLLHLKERGIVRSVGVATPLPAAAAIVRAHESAFDAVQFPSQILDTTPVALQGATVPLRLTHGVLATPLARIQERLASDRSWMTLLSERVGTDMAAPGMLPRLLLAAALADNPRGIVLVGTSKIEHLRDAPRAIGAFGADQVRSAVDFIRTTLGATSQRESTASPVGSKLP